RGQTCGRTDDRRVGPVRRAERVVHVQVVALAQRVDEGRVVAGLARVEAQVLEQLHPGCQLCQALPDRLDRVGRVRRTLGSAEVRAGGHAGAALPEPLQRGQCSTNAQVVGDDAVPDG